jgi:hypothetical protein
MLTTTLILERAATIPVKAHMIPARAHMILAKALEISPRVTTTLIWTTLPKRGISIMSLTKTNPAPTRKNMSTRATITALVAMM